MFFYLLFLIFQEADYVIKGEIVKTSRKDNNFNQKNKSKNKWKNM